MTLAHARAMLGAIPSITIPHDPIRDDAALGALARWALRWTPLSHAEPPACLLLDITGCEHLFGGERGMAASLRAAIERMSFTCRIAVASTVGASWAVAHHGSASTAFISPGREHEAIASLPVAALRIDPDIVESLAEIGVETIAQVLDLPRITLPSRYGSDLLRRIDQALGQAPEPVHGVTPTVPPVITLELPGGTTQWESLSEGVRALLTGLTASLRQSESGVTRLEARFTRLDAPPASICIELSRPTRARLHLWSLMRPRLERLHMGAGIERIELLALRTAPITHEQGAFAGFGPDEDCSTPDVEVAQALEIVAGRLGPDRIRRFTRHASHRPERAWSTEPTLGHAPAPAPAHTPDLLPGAPRPSRMFDPPEPAEVTAMCPEGPVLRLTWRGGHHTVRTCLGPERIGPEWWACREAQRDYFRIQDEHGLWLWLFRDLTSGQWCVHGVWM